MLPNGTGIKRDSRVKITPKEYKCACIHMVAYTTDSIVGHSTDSIV